MDEGQSQVVELLARFRSAERLEGCLAPLADSRAVAGCAIVGFKEGHDGPAVARMPRPQFWARQFGWPSNFMRQWLRLNVSRASLMPETSRSRPDIVTAWSVPLPETLPESDEQYGDRALGARFLLGHGISSGITATVRRPSGACAQVSWLKPLEEPGVARPCSERGLLAIAQGFFDALDRVRPSAAPDALTPRELECLLWAAYGCSDKEIAQEILCAHDTVRFHIKNVVRKLGASNRTHAVALGIQQGLIRLGGVRPAVDLQS